MRRVTEKELVELEACEYAVEAFCEEWPDGVVVTLKNVQRAVDLDLPVEWYVRRMVMVDNRAAWGIYLREIALAWKACKECGDWRANINAYLAAVAHALYVALATHEREKA